MSPETGRSPNSSQGPDEAERELFVFLDSYWEALRGGRKTSAEDRPGDFPGQGHECLSYLRLLDSLNDTCQALHEDTHADLASTADLPLSLQEMSPQSLLNRLS